MRDRSLDLLKGIACVLMIFAHSSGIESILTGILYGNNSHLVEYVYKIGETAPIFFFAVTGVVACMQAAKYPPKSILLQYSFLFLLGFSYNGITEINYYQDFSFEIIQIIAIGAVFVFLTQYFIKPPLFVFLGIGFSIFLMKLISDHNVWVHQILSLKGGLLIPPGPFPVLPWLSLFFLGPFAYYTKNRNNLIAASISIGLLVILKLFSIPLQPGNKWDMSIGYFLLSCVLLFMSFFVVRIYVRQEKLSQGLVKRIEDLILFLGVNSLLFLYIHKFIIRLLHNLATFQYFYQILRHPIVFWSLVLAITVLLMKLILEIFPLSLGNKFLGDIRTWIILVGLILVIPIIIDHTVVIYSFELFFGIIFSIYYPQLRNLLKSNHLERNLAVIKERG